MPYLRPKDGRPPARPRRLARASGAWLSSLSAHVLALLVLQATGGLDFLSHPRSWAIAIQPVSAVQWEANRGLGAASPPRFEEPRTIIALPPDTANDPAREELPPTRRTRYLAARDQTVDKETFSKHADVTSGRVLRVPQERAKGRQGSGERGKNKIAVPGREGLRGGGGADADAAAPRSPPPDAAATPELAAAVVGAAPSELASSEPAAPNDEPPDLPPEDSAIPSDGEGGQRIDGRRIGGMPLREYPRPEGGPDLDGAGLEEGAETRLHARRFAPAAFWTEVRARIMNDWEKRALLLTKEYDPLEDTYFYKPRTVVVGLTLDPKGGVTRVKIVESSRLDFYDAIAVASVREMQPYPEPPRAAIGPDGGASINVRFTWNPSDRKRTLR